MESLEQQLDAWAKGYLDAERLPCLALAVIQGNEVTCLAAGAQLSTTALYPVLLLLLLLLLLLTWSVASMAR